MDEQNFDAVISDYQMPCKDGIEFLKVLRGRGDKTPFIIFTGKGREEVAIEGLNNDADFHIQKDGGPRSQFAESSHHIKFAINGRRSEDASMKQEAKDAAIDGMAIYDAEGNLMHANHSYMDIYGYESLDEIPGKPGDISYQDDELHILPKKSQNPFVMVNPTGVWNMQSKRMVWFSRRRPESRNCA